MAFSTFFLDVSWASPPSRNSSRMKYAFSKLKIISNSHTCEATTQTAADQRSCPHWKQWITHCGPLTLSISGLHVRRLRLTLPKYLSSSSTYLWMISRVMSSLSWSSTAQQKYRLAYLKHEEGRTWINKAAMWQMLVPIFTCTQEGEGTKKQTVLYCYCLSGDACKCQN